MSSAAAIFAAMLISGYLQSYVGRPLDGAGRGAVHGVFRMLWYVSFQKSQRGLAPIDPQTAAGLVDMLLHGGLGKAQARGDFLVRKEGRQPQAFFLSCAEALQHVTLRTFLDC